VRVWSIVRVAGFEWLPVRLSRDDKIFSHRRLIYRTQMTISQRRTIKFRPDKMQVGVISEIMMGDGTSTHMLSITS
jgi:hypothetical protein